ncbi:cellulase family glycosylhydrolase [Rhizocola hellebori]|nr:cellulase family glycosylhydrolase [Rhizocola hellebori]
MLQFRPQSARWKPVLAAGIAAVTVATGLVAGASAYAAAGCRVNYAVQAQWPGGFTGNVEITNLGDPISGWSLVWTFGSGQRIGQMWNASYTQPAAVVTATNMSYNAAIPANGKVSFGFNGSWSGSNAVPASFTLNGVTCTGSPATPSPTQSATPSPSTSPSQSPSPQPNDPMQIVVAMQPGTNIGNTLDAIPDETSWGNPPINQALLDHLRAQGFKSVRLPITWSNHHGPGPGYAIDAAWLSRIRQVVDWALADGFYVMINLHHDSWQWINTYPTDRASVLARYNALWTQIATAFRGHSPKLLFESINEPQFTGTSGDEQNYQLLNELNAEFVRIVRGTGGGNASRLLVLPTLFTNADQGRLDALRTAFAQLNDRNLAATIHFYGFWPFSVNNSGFTRYNAEVEQDLVGTFERAANTLVANGIPVILGEYLLLSLDYTRPGIIEQGEVLKFFEAFGYQARTKRITTMLWEAGTVLNRQELRWREPELMAQVTSSWTTRSGTASADQIYVPRTGAIAARALTLNLNGTTFQGLRQGSTDLVSGRDYTVSGNTLTLTAAAMTRLAGNRAAGVNTNIQARFSQGVPWRISIISYDPPVLSNATGTTSGFTLPAQFRGDQLATMEAKYADGSVAGPYNWTSFKEFWTHFQPDYNAGTIIMKPEFFNEVNDGARVTLTFHFWSGTQITYFVTKSGSSVTGTTS